LKRFISASASGFKKAEWILLGAPLDSTVSRQPGSSKAPQSIRDESWNLETFSFSIKRDLEDVNFFDIGDLVLQCRPIEIALDIIYKVANHLFKNRKKVLSFGGEHLVSYGLIKAAAETHPGLHVIHLDAHADLRDTYHGERFTHATVMRRVAEECLDTPSNLYQFGIRSGTKQEYEWGKNNTRLFEEQDIVSALSNVINDLQDKPIYISLDIDIFDPSIAPGTGTPEPGGVIDYREVLNFMTTMGSLNIVGMDIVEVCPLLDINNITSVLAAKIAREALLLWGVEKVV
jgi:agmatinase